MYFSTFNNFEENVEKNELPSTKENKVKTDDHLDINCKDAVFHIINCKQCKELLYPLCSKNYIQLFFDEIKKIINNFIYISSGEYNIVNIILILIVIYILYLICK